MENNSVKSVGMRKEIISLFMKVALPVSIVLFLLTLLFYFSFHGREDIFFKQNIIMVFRILPVGMLATLVIAIMTCYRRCIKGVILQALPLILFYFSYLYIEFNAGFQSKNVIHQAVFLFIFSCGVCITVNGLFALAGMVKNRVLAFIYSALAVLCQVSAITIAGTFWWYYHQYHSVFNGDAALAILMTNHTEAIEFLGAHMSYSFIWAVGIILFSYMGYVMHYYKRSEKSVFFVSKPVLLGLTIILGGVSLVLPFTKIPVIQDFNQTKDFLSTLPEKEKYYENNTEKLVFTSDTRNKVPEGSVILVIGESATRDRMKAFAPSYKRETTPWESKEIYNPNFIFFPKSYSNFPLTAEALMMYLTNRNQYTNINPSDKITILDVAKKLGYHTYWLSNQGMFGGSDATTSVIASRADKIQWVKTPIVGPDEQVLSLLEKIDGNQKNFIIVHIRGSHYEYDKRYPESFSKLYPDMTPYEKSIAYTDEVLKDIYEYGRSHMNLQIMLYCSDHGEDMKYGHTPALNDFNMVRIPFWIYLAPSYQKALPDKMNVLKTHENSYFTNDLMYEVICGLLGGETTNSYQSVYDISSPDYGITKDNALTLYGKRHISEDPMVS